MALAFTGLNLRDDIKAVLENISSSSSIFTSSSLISSQTSFDSKYLKKIFVIQSTLVISNSKGPSTTLRDIRTLTNQICSIEENTIRTTKFHKWLCNLTPLVRNIYWKYCGKGEKLLLLWKRGETAPQEQFLLFSTIFYNLISDFCVKTRTRFSLWDKPLFEIIEVKITRVDNIKMHKYPREVMSLSLFACLLHWSQLWKVRNSPNEEIHFFFFSKKY